MITDENRLNLAKKIHRLCLSGDEYETEMQQIAGLLKDYEAVIRSEYRFKNWLAQVIIGRKMIRALCPPVQKARKK